MENTGKRFLVRYKLFGLVAALTMLLLAVAPTFAQSQSEGDEACVKGLIVRATGTLETLDTSTYGYGNYAITDRDSGCRYALENAGVNLGDYVGQTVAIKGAAPGRGDYGRDAGEPTLIFVDSVERVGQTIYGTSGPDSLLGTFGDDAIYGFGGGDRIEAAAGGDLVRGGTGGDLLIGGSGDDLLIGGPGDDAVYGSGGSDAVYGSGGNDLLNTAGDGVADRVVGGSGGDRCVVGREDLPYTSGCEAVVVR